MPITIAAILTAARITHNSMKLESPVLGWLAEVTVPVSPLAAAVPFVVLVPVAFVPESVPVPVLALVPVAPAPVILPPAVFVLSFEPLSAGLSEPLLLVFPSVPPAVSCHAMASGDVP